MHLLEGKSGSPPQKKTRPIFFNFQIMSNNMCCYSIVVFLCSLGVQYQQTAAHRVCLDEDEKQIIVPLATNLTLTNPCSEHLTTSNRDKKCSTRNGTTRTTPIPTSNTKRQREVPTDATAKTNTSARRPSRSSPRI